MWFVLGLCALCYFWVLVSVSVFSQVGPGLVYFVISFCLGLCVVLYSNSGGEFH